MTISKNTLKPVKRQPRGDNELWAEVLSRAMGRDEWLAECAELRAKYPKRAAAGKWAKAV